MRNDRIRNGLACAGILVTLTGCGYNHSAALSSETRRSAPRMLVSFTDWCLATQLNCPTGAPANVPSETVVWNSAQWESVLAVARGVIDGGQGTRLSSDDLIGEDVAGVAEMFGLDAEFAKLQARLRAVNVTDLSLNHSSVAVRLGEDHVVRDLSGLQLGLKNAFDVTLDDQSSIQFSGVSLAGPSSGPSSALVQLRSLKIPEPNVSTLTVTGGGGEKRIESTPLKFIAEVLTGDLIGSHPGEPVPEKGGYKALVRALPKAAQWLSRGTKILRLDQTMLASYSKNLPPLMDKRDVAAAMAFILGELTAIESTPESRPSAFLKASAAASFICHINGRSMLLFDEKFGIKSISATSQGTRVSLYGVRAKPTHGLIRPTIELSTIDLEPTRIIIYNVPVVGTKVIDLTDPDEQHKKFECGL